MLCYSFGSPRIQLGLYCRMNVTLTCRILCFFSFQKYVPATDHDSKNFFLCVLGSHKESLCQEEVFFLYLRTMSQMSLVSSTLLILSKMIKSVAALCIAEQSHLRHQLINTIIFADWESSSGGKVSDNN